MTSTQVEGVGATTVAEAMANRPLGMGSVKVGRG